MVEVEPRSHPVGEDSHLAHLAEEVYHNHPAVDHNLLVAVDSPLLVDHNLLAEGDRRNHPEVEEDHHNLPAVAVRRILLVEVVNHCLARPWHHTTNRYYRGAA